MVLRTLSLSPCTDYLMFVRKRTTSQRFFQETSFVGQVSWEIEEQVIQVNQGVIVPVQIPINRLFISQKLQGTIISWLAILMFPVIMVSAELCLGSLIGFGGFQRGTMLLNMGAPFHVQSVQEPVAP